MLPGEGGGNGFGPAFVFPRSLRGSTRMDSCSPTLRGKMEMIISKAFSGTNNPHLAMFMKNII